MAFCVTPAAEISEMIFIQSIAATISEFRCLIKRQTDLNYRNTDNMEEINRTPFGQRLFDSREAANLTQEQASKKAGMAQSTLAEAEISGKRSGYTPQLAELYRVSAKWLATGKGDVAPSSSRQNENSLQDRQVPPEETLSDEAARLVSSLAEPDRIEVLHWLRLEAARRQHAAALAEHKKK